ncbi:ABC transporter ATP-binding protein [Hymenobacter sp. CA2-7]|uniref:ABC transporter ATP-binding protein n=1 Tax=Hymenobacter sp. CA2-7 TaxID=3063993 RepID=UPI002713A82C|nr:ABC transporter ATP-binding protein [Hymenobacter sp. CA2-7]MDO7884451.1 ABC transporter ATP-binding protein [Hymenobacter sp. CA2-7]
MELLEVRDLSFAEQGIQVIQPLSFMQRQGQKLALVGESGAGKSTLLQLITGLVQPSTGEIRVVGNRVRGPEVALVPGHPGVAYLSQKSDLPKFLRVEQVLGYASKRPARETHSLYKLCRIDHLLQRRTDQLSGGEQQRVALARLLLGQPQLLLLDEPFSNLDRVHKRQMQAIVEEVVVRLGVTCLLVSHEATDVLGWADELLVLRRGRLVQQGSPERVYQEPVDEYTAALLGDYHLLTGANRLALAPNIAGPGALLVRPEQLQLGAVEAGKPLGTVRAVRFLGSYYELEVKVAAMLVRARASQPRFAVGEHVSVQVAASAKWLLQEPE